MYRKIIPKKYLEIFNFRIATAKESTSRLIISCNLKTAKLNNDRRVFLMSEHSATHAADTVSSLVLQFLTTPSEAKPAACYSRLPSETAPARIALLRTRNFRIRISLDVSKKTPKRFLKVDVTEVCHPSRKSLNWNLFKSSKYQAAVQFRIR